MIPKFRVWLPDTTQMLRVKALVFEKDRTRCVCGYSFDFSLEDENATIMQSTGISDKNDREIFEGDILKIENEEDSEALYVNVYWDKEHALFMVETKKYNDKGALAELLEDNSYPCEVVGNIYQDKEFLERV